MLGLPAAASSVAAEDVGPLDTAMKDLHGELRSRARRWRARAEVRCCAEVKSESWQGTSSSFSQRAESTSSPGSAGLVRTMLRLRSLVIRLGLQIWCVCCPLSLSDRTHSSSRPAGRDLVRVRAACRTPREPGGRQAVSRCAAIGKSRKALANHLSQSLNVRAHRSHRPTRTLCISPLRARSIL